MGKRRKLYLALSLISGIIGIVLVSHPYIPEIYFTFVSQEVNEIPYYVTDPDKLGIKIATHTESGKANVEVPIKDEIKKTQELKKDKQGQASNKNDESEAQEAVKESGDEAPAETEARYYPEENRLVIPQIGVDAEILESPSLDILWRQKGVWHEPDTGNPEDGKHMMVAGHRFQYQPPNNTTFYNLDRLNYGDRFLVYWNQQDYVYEVSEIRVVSPMETSVRWDDPEKNEITLYSCTPIGSTKSRLIIKATLI